MRPDRAVAAVPPGFTAAGERRTGTYVLQEFRAGTPQPVDPAALYPAGETEAALVP